MTLNVLIVDDEPPARRRLRRLLRAIGEVEVVGESGDGADAVDAIRSLAPDVVMLDIQMPEFDGFEVIKAAGADLPAIIFVTAHDQYALQAFEVHALDYLLKPVDADRVARAIERARAWHVARLRPPQGDARVAALLEQFIAEKRFLKRLPVRVGDRLLVIDLGEVDWISAADNYVTLHVGKRELLVRGTLTWLERELDPSQFVRVHRGTIVRADRVAELIPESHGDMTVRLQNGAQLAVSRQYRARLEEIFSL